jgi:hypothetical protein
LHEEPRQLKFRSGARVKTIRQWGVW